jgi:beta-mannanase
MYYPGSAYVDMIGLTGYNTGNYYPGERWRSFKEIYDPLYHGYEPLFSGKPFMITEFGANVYGGDKAAWITDAFKYLPDYPRISLAIWWNGIDMDGQKKARIYRLEDLTSQMAFKNGLAGY